MKYFMKYFICLVLVSMLQHAAAQAPHLYLINAAKIEAIKKSAAKNKTVEDGIRQLTKEADKLLPKKFGSVIDKKFAPACGNMHEYYSKARYYWPDPSKPDGKPYIRKDGQKNPDNDLISDDKNFDDLISAVNTLSWAYYFSGEEKYAEKSITLMRFWFLDTATYMMPNLNHAQERTGIDTGVSSGIIDTHLLPQVVDAISLLRASKCWNATDEAGMKQWFTAYLQWLRTSKNGKKESQAKNNHGTFYDNQVVTIALFCGEKKIAAEKLQTEFARIASQIEPDGKQPLELARTNALGYSIFNLEAWSMLANAAATTGVGLWHYQTADGRSIRKAIDYLLPYVADGKKWEYQQIGPYKPEVFYHILLLAADQYKDDNYRLEAEKIKASLKKNVTNFLFE
ncbi:MAG: alginate lyase family protein [Bacteroidetes bacterium]|nr:alginate lyase family protein [Bacteroidota bacterium]